MAELSKVAPELRLTEYGLCLVCPLCREVTKPNEPGPNRPLEQYCYYCTHENFKRYRKIGHKALWTGLLPKWCPRLEE